MKSRKHWLPRDIDIKRFSRVRLSLFALLFGLIGTYIIFRSLAATTITPVPLISKNVPVYASSQQYPASNANDGSYDTEWRSNGTGWIAYDLSSVPTAKRSTVDVVWYGGCCSYDNSISGTGAYNLPGSYTVQANAAAGGGSSAPSSGWVTLATVTNNTYHSRQHILNLTGYNWLRMNVTVVDGSAGNTDVSINLEVRDASAGTNDDWIFYGDSITEGAMGQGTTSNSIKSFQDMINAQIPNNFPVEENGGIGYQTTDSALTYIDAQLALFPGKYVGLAFGTNDAGCGSTTCLNTFYNNYVQLVQKVLNLGKVPIVPTIPWGCTGNLTANVPSFNQKIQALYTAFPQIIKGPDFYTYFSNNKSYIQNSDCIHPNDAGMGLYRQLMANTMLANIYNSTTNPAPTVTISANPSTITTGSSAALTWSSTNATSCTASGGWSGSKATSGTQSVSPTATTSYTLTCAGAGGSANNAASVIVNPVSGKTGDINGDGQVNIFDLSILLTNYGGTTASCDLNHDGAVNILDLSILLTNYGS